MDNLIAVVSCHVTAVGPREICRSARERGFDAVEWFAFDRNFLAPDTLGSIVECSAAYGVTNTFHAPFAGPWVLAEKPAEAISGAIEELIATAVAIRSRMITLHPGAPRDGEEPRLALRRLADGIDACLPRLEAAGVTLAIENQTRCFNKRELCAETADLDYLLARLPSPRVGITLDTGHANIVGNLHEIVGRFAGRIANIHLSDNSGRDDGHLPPGEGTVDWDFFYSFLRDGNYRGVLALEFPEETGCHPAVLRKLRSL